MRSATSSEGPRLVRIAMQWRHSRSARMSNLPPDYNKVRTDRVSRFAQGSVACQLCVGILETLETAYT